MLPVISPLRLASRMALYSASIWIRMASRRSMISDSASQSVVPMVVLPLNIMCSKRWAMPVMP